MYSYIIAKLLNIDLSRVRDGNPGASNLWRIAGWRWGVLALVLDYLKGVIPISIFINLGIVGDRYIITLAALAGVLGHSFSPMLKFKGGKAVAVSFGAWSVLTKWEAPTLLGSVFTLFTIIKPKNTTVGEDAFRVFIGYLVLLFYVIFKAYRGEIHLLFFYLGNFLIIFYKHKKDLIEFFKKIKFISNIL